MTYDLQSVCEFMPSCKKRKIVYNGEKEGKNMEKPSIARNTGERG